MSSEPDGRPANHKDRLCDMCHQPMIGIMRESEPCPPRRICNPCGGIPIKYDDNGDPK